MNSRVAITVILALALMPLIFGCQTTKKEEAQSVALESVR